MARVESVPESRRRVERLCGEVLRRSDSLGRQAALRIREEIPSLKAVPFDEHCRAATEYIRVLVGAWQVPGDPARAQLEGVRALVSRRLTWGIPLHDTLRASHVAFRVLWDALHDAAAEPADAEALVQIVGLLTLWTEVRSAAIANIYMEEIGSQHERVMSLRHRLLEALRHGEGTASQAAGFARELGFDPDGGFQASCAPAGQWPHDRLDLLQRSVGSLRGTVHCGVSGPVMVVLIQGVNAAQVSAAVAELTERPCLGIGLLRTGLIGAAQSIHDAEQALGLAQTRGGGSVSFEREWHAAQMASLSSQLEPLIGAGRAVAADHPELAETVLVFFETGLSLADAADRLFVHRNSVVYRLNRWKELTGWDPRVMEDLLRSVVAAAPHAKTRAHAVRIAQART